MDLVALDQALGAWRAEREACARGRVRALKLLGELGAKKARWWARNRAVVRTYQERREACERDTWSGHCLHCGVCGTWTQGCGAHYVCAPCAKRKAQKYARGLTREIRRAHAREVAKYHAAGRPPGGFPTVTLMTFTVRSSTLADLSARRALLSVAWNRWATWYAETYRQRLSYARTVECTPGECNDQGHVHFHVVCVLPFRDYKVLGDAWWRATGGIGSNVDFQRRSKDAASAARYVAKYASKGVRHLGVTVGAAWIQAQHQKRSLSCSRDWKWNDLNDHGPWYLTKARTSAIVDESHAPPGHAVPDVWSRADGDGVFFAARAGPYEREPGEEG